MTIPSAPSKRPGGRTARVGQAVQAAVRSLIAEHGQDGFTGREVAERAGVNEATIYRRWGKLDNLVLDVALSVARLNERSPIPDTGSLRGDLRIWAGTIAASVARPRALEFLRTVLAARSANGAAAPDGADPLRELLAERAGKIQAALDRAARRGESAPNLGVVLDRLVAPLYLRAIFGYTAPAHDLDGLVEYALQPGCKAGRSSRTRNRNTPTA